MHQLSSWKRCKACSALVLQELDVQSLSTAFVSGSSAHKGASDLAPSEVHPVHPPATKNWSAIPKKSTYYYYSIYFSGIFNSKNRVQRGHDQTSISMRENKKLTASTVFPGHMTSSLHNNKTTHLTGKC
eukprot:jgi/Botrbrau1/1650/Bobra.0185s0060.1